MEWRFTFFVTDAERQTDGWIVRGEPGLGPPAVGDVFTVVHHPESGSEDAVALTVESTADTELHLAGANAVDLVAGDVLGGASERGEG